MAKWEKQHIIEAFGFELNNVQTNSIRERVLNELLANVADELASEVGKHIGMTPKRRNPTGITPEASAPPPSNKSKQAIKSSPALSMNRPPDGIKGRKIAILAADGVDAVQLAQIKTSLAAEGALSEVIGQFGGTIKTESGESIAVDKPAPNAPSVIYDAVFIPGGKASITTLLHSLIAIQFIKEAYSHCKPIAALGEGMDLLMAADIELPADKAKVMSHQGVVIASGRDLKAFAKTFIDAIALHRHFDRSVE